ncbi:TPA: hypothetical protein HA297_02330 [Candidatus Woesearchaeota archaeon]|nr:hypothetical protein [Candidatus Woesearchaeota archaeon]
MKHKNKRGIMDRGIKDRKIMQNKKGFSILFSIGIGFFLAVLFLLFFLPGTKTQPFIGNSQLELLKEDRLLQSQLTMIVDPLGEYSVKRAYTQLAYQGGYQDPEQAPCGAFDGYAIWKKEKKPCYPLRIHQEFLNLAQTIMNEYTQSFDEIPEDNYDLRILEETKEINREETKKTDQEKTNNEQEEKQEQRAIQIIGIAKKPIQRKTQHPMPVAVLAAQPSFSVALAPSPFDEYAVLIDAIQGKEQPTKTSERGIFNYAELCDRYETLLQDCMQSWAQQKNEEEPVKAQGLFFEVGACIQDKEREEGTQDKNDKNEHADGRNVKFCVKSRQLGLAFDATTGTYRLQPLVYRFAIQFGEKN